MSAPTAADVKAFAPELAGETDERVALFIETAGLYINESYWGRKYKHGTILLTAHLITLANRNTAGNGAGAVGPVVSEKVGDLSQTYAQPQVSGSDSDPSLALTSYGIQYISLRRTLTITPLVT